MAARSAFASIAFVIALSSGAAIAAPCSVPNSLTNGSTADATQVMADFNSILACAAPVANPSFTGSVGIGTTAPGAKLQIVGAGGANGALLASDNGSSIAYGNVTLYGTSSLPALAVIGQSGVTSDGVIRLDGFGAGYTAYIKQRAGGTNTLDFIQNGNIAISINGNGNVGIGTTAPSFLLTVNGTAFASGAAGALSDRRHKTEIKPFVEDALALVASLKPVTFRWKEPKDSGMKGRQIGFIAQDVLPVLPDAVLTMSDADKTLGLKYNEFIPVLTKAIQEQQAEINELVLVNRQQGAALRAANQKQSERLSALEAQFAELQRREQRQTAAR